MIRLYDLCVATRRYTHNGEEKAVWLNIGSILQGDKDPFMMLKAYFNPAGITRKENSESIAVSMFTPKDSTYDYDIFCWTSSQYAKLYDLCVGTRRYTSNGQEKTAWENVGAIMMGDNHPYLMLKAHFNPAAITRKEGSESIAISLFKPKREGQDSYGGSDDEAFNDTGFNSTVDVPF